ncbi:MAG: UDP-N-acetylmuramate dehydrogenase [Phycisphaeraceae bacterium]|nr:MAG: UDP-N-acetylmuramate dehydrogenase [Phycisphaeraceae bacterium]
MGHRVVTTSTPIVIETDVPILTWFGVGGGADMLARPASIQELRTLLGRDEPVRILGEGANLLVDDGGVDGLVISLENICDVLELEEGGLLCVEAGADLPKLIIETVRRGFGGLEGLGGIPATIGGATFMNAGGAFGEIFETVERVHTFDPDRNQRSYYKDELKYGYRTGGLDGHLIAAVELRLTEGDPDKLRDRLKEVMAYKKTSQPMKENSAGCVFRNPLVDGERTSAGKLIDEAGCKGLREGGAEVSDRHANFFITREGCTARDILKLIDAVRERVLKSAGVELETEIAIWRRGDMQ